MKRKDGVKGTQIRKQGRNKSRKWRSSIQEERGEHNGKQERPEQEMEMDQGEIEGRPGHQRKEEAVRVPTSEMCPEASFLMRKQD